MVSAVTEKYSLKNCVSWGEIVMVCLEVRENISIHPKSFQYSIHIQTNNRKEVRW